MNRPGISFPVQYALLVPVAGGVKFTRDGDGEIALFPSEGVASIRANYLADFYKIPVAIVPVITPR